MRILISSHLFAPSVGGIEQVSGILAEEFAALGHEVRVITQTSCENEPAAPYAVFRRPNPARLFALVSWSDVYFQNNLSIATLWPAWLLKKPIVISHQTWISQPDGRMLWRECVKRWCTHFVSRNIAISPAIARALPVASTPLANPYRDDIFFTERTRPRERDLVFVGRLVTDKGASLLIAALVILRSRGLEPGLTLVGDGPERGRLQHQVQEMNVSDQVTFTGILTGAELRATLNRHRILVVPSLWAEPFGIVALEGAACGCIVVGSEKGGLPDAIGPCGRLFPNGNEHALADCLEMALNTSNPNIVSPSLVENHLTRHGRKRTAEAYLDIFKEVLKR